MRWFILVSCYAIATLVVAEPEPKKYKPVDKKTESLTNEEKQFLREVEEKFGVKSDVPKESSDKETEHKEIKLLNLTQNADKKLTFPAVIAIEIVNDTDSKGKGKRTIDANLGYGYRTNNGYSYNYFGKSSQDKGKFMIYPYSQQDIPSRQNVYTSDYSQSGDSYQKTSTNVEIQPSQAFELVPVKEQQSGYEYKKPEVEFKTPSPTLYTTYNGQEFSGLSSQFPSVMPNYFVDPSQLLTNPQYQNAGLTQDHLRSHEPQLTQRIVPVLVLRIPSSSIKNPSAELYANLPNNYPLSSYLNNVNLQQLVNQYFKKHGYSFAPQIMAYQNSHQAETEPQHYANPYVQPSYTEADYSGVQYSAVKPVMAKYPSSYHQHKYVVSHQQPAYYQSPQQNYEYQSPQQNYEHQYQYTAPAAAEPQSHYAQTQYEQPASSHEYESAQPSADQHANLYDTNSQVEYKTPDPHSQEISPESYDAHSAHQQSVQPTAAYYTAGNTATQYDVASEYAKEAVQPEYETKTYSSSSLGQKGTHISVYPSRLIHSEQYEESSAVNSGHDYSYQAQAAAAESLPLSENYPSKDHTIATVFPNSQYSAQKPKQTVQSVSYVTPMPSAKYQSQYRIMVPQTVFKTPTSEKVSYVNSHSVPMHYTQAGRYRDIEQEEEYTTGSHYVPAAASRPTYPRNYRSHPKRMAKPENKPAPSVKVSKKHNERSETKKSS